LRSVSDRVKRPGPLTVHRWLFFVLLAAACSHNQRPTTNHERFDKPDEAALYFSEKRGITADFDLTAKYAAARDRIRRMPQAVLGDPPVSAFGLTTKINGAWTPLGPGNVGGRTRALLIDPENADVMYAAAVSGGVWKTVDGGASWSTVTDLLPNIAVNSLAFDPKDSRVIYAGTGEGYFREDIRGTALPIRGNGIYVSRNAGASWEQLASTAGADFYWVNDLVVSTHDSNRIYAATRNGVFRSADGGTTWTRVVPTTVKGGCLDLAFRGDTANDYLFASCGTFAQATVYRSTQAEGSNAWTPVLSEPGMGRTSLAIAPSNPSIVYAMAAQNGGPNDQGLFAVFRSSASGDAGSWVAQTRPTAAADVIGPLLLTNVLSAVTDENCSGINMQFAVPMGWHCNVIAVDPTDPDRVWAGGVDLFRSDDGGKTWGVASFWWTAEETPSFVHADQHVIVFHPEFNGASNQTMYAATDGGMFRTDNSHATVALGLKNACLPIRSEVAFRKINGGYATTQFYHGAVYPGGRFFLGGAQDNGTWIGSEDNPQEWRPVTGGDGGYVAVDQNDPALVYSEAQGARMFRSFNGGENFVFVGAPQGDSFIFIAPFLVDPNRRETVWLGGGKRLWRNQFTTQGWTPSGISSAFGNISALALARGGTGRLLFGTTDGAIHRGDTLELPAANMSWPSTRPRTGWVSSIAFDPVNSNVAYATYAGFGGTHVWKTSDGGETWSALDGSGEGALPDIPAHSIAVAGSTLYLGTDLGIFVSTDGGQHWAAERTFPRAITETVLLADTARGQALFAFTHGRGAWRIDLQPPPRRRAIRR
jgi:photosystem II stability/assembly factor-like uncharacterized protein